jgi:hypothetical protein
MLVALMVAFAAQQGAASGASVHPADPALFLEIPDVARLLDACEHAPWVQMVRDDAARKSAASLLATLDIDSSAALGKALDGLGVPPTFQSITVDEVLARMRTLRSLSISVALTEKSVGELARAATAVNACHNSISELASALEAFAAAHSETYPEHVSELEHAEQFKLDTWGHPYVYTPSADRHGARVQSLGADGLAGGFGADADIDEAFEFKSWLSAELERRLGIELCLDFSSQDQAREAVDALAAVTLKDESPPAAPASIALSGAAATLKQFRMTYGAHPRAWTLQANERVVLGIGGTQLADVVQRFDGHGPSLGDSAKIKQLRASLAPSTGATVVNGFCDLQTLTVAFPQLAESLRKGTGGLATQFGSAFESIAWRMQLEGERFTTEAVTTRNASAPSWLAAVANKPVPADLVHYVPEDAIGVYLTSLDGNALHRQVLELLGLASGDAESTGGALAQIEAKHDFNLKRDVFDSLGAGVALYLLPISSMAGLPGAAIVIELRDAAAFEHGLRGLLATLEEQGSTDFKIKSKKYRDVPMWTFTFGAEEPNPSAGGLSSILTVSPTITIVKNHAIITLTSVRATKEIKRALGEEGAPHRLASLAKPPPPEATSIGYMDWPSAFDGLFGAARGALALAGGFAGELPFDVNKVSAALPEPKTFSHFFQPTLLWTKSVEGGTYIHNESSFGPESWVNLFAIGAGGYYALLDMTHKKAEAATAIVPATKAQDAATAEATKAALQNLATRIAVFQLDQERLPKQLDELLEATANYPQGFVDGGKLPTDSWNHMFEYQLSPDGAHYRLWSIGPDGVDAAGAGDDLLAP